MNKENLRGFIAGLTVSEMDINEEEDKRLYGDVDFHIKYNHLEEICTDLDHAIDELFELVHKLETEEQIYERMGEYETLSKINGERVKFRKCMRKLEEKREVVLEMLDEMDATLELNEKNRESFERLFFV